MRRPLVFIMMILAAVFALAVTPAVKPATVGQAIKPGAVDQTLFVVCGTVNVGAFMFGTDGGGVLYRCDGAAHWVQVVDGVANAIEHGGDAGTAGVLDVTFGAAFRSLPDCVCSNVQASPVACGPTGRTTTGATFTVNGGGATVIEYICSGPR
jgi:hypothetical protein